jgi:hypothetical protein
MRRRYTPYSQLAEVRAGRSALLALVLTTLALGLTLSLVSDALYEALGKQNVGWFWILCLGLGATLGLTLAAVWLFYSQAESRLVRLEMWLPYHLPAGNQVTIVHQPAYPVTRRARGVWTRRYRESAQPTRDWLTRWRQARADDVPFYTFALDDHVALSQCLLLYALHRASDEILGSRAAYGWWKVDLAVRPWSMDALPSPLRDNPFLRAEQHADEWRLLLPEDVTFDLTTTPGAPWPRWTFRHRRYGEIVLQWKPHVVVAERDSQVWHILTQHLRPGERSELYILNARLEAHARFRWTLLPRSDPFHRWATSLLAHLEETLDWGYFLETRSARILADLEWKMGWWERDDSLVDALARIEGRLEEIEMGIGGGKEGAESRDWELEHE